MSFQVPAFLMIAGFLYQRPGALPWREVERRLRRSLIPYAIASGVAYGIGFWNPANVQEALSQLAAWQTVGIYPFIRMLALCVVAACPLSRLSLRASGHALAAFAVAATALGIWGRILGLGFAIPPYTGVSVNLLTDAVLYPLTYFLIGWLTAAFLSRLASRAARFEPQLLALGLAVIACWFAAAPAFETLAHFADVARALYSVAVVGVLAITTQRLRVPRVILFLSEASLGIYLYHIFFELIFAPHAAAWPPLLRILASASIDLAGAAAVCLLARRVLGGRLARALIGA